MLPAVSKEVDYEAELVVIIGLGGRNIPLAEARRHIAGYCPGHDVSARDWQLRKPGGQWLLGKSFDTFAHFWPGAGHPRRDRRPGAVAYRASPERPHDAELKHAAIDFRSRPPGKLHLAGMYAFSGRRHLHWHAAGRGPCASRPCFCSPAMWWKSKSRSSVYCESCGCGTGMNTP